MASQRITHLAYLITVSLLLLLAYPALFWLGRSWATNPYYTHGFLVPLVAAVIAWRQWRRFASAPRQGYQWLGMVISAAALAIVVWAMAWQDYYVASLALVILLAGILLYLEGWERLKHWLFPVLFLALMVPLPSIDLASPWLEAFTASAATSLARLVGISAVHQGSEITLPGSTLIVGAPCSGLRSLVAMVTVGVAWVYVVKGKLAPKAIMLFSIVPLVILSNVFRIAILLVIAQLFGAQTALTYYHDWSSPVLFLMALALLLVLGKLLGCSQIRDDLFQ